MQIEEVYMQRCLQLASFTKSFVPPNPMVGSVIVHQGKIIGEGYHTACGCAHAEVEAIRSVTDHSLLKDSTLYVNLEPCSHYGKTPPCAKLIIEKGISRVVVGTLDPFPEVSGRGVKMLQEAGVEVIVNVLTKECRALNKTFFCYLEKKRPYIVLKWAQTRDGYIDRLRQEGDVAQPTPISNPITRIQVHKLRSEVQSILVGTTTAINDNPSLTVRYWSGNNPVRLVLDKSMRIPSGFQLFDGLCPTFTFTNENVKSKNNCEFISIDYSINIIPQILNVLYQRKIQSVLVEGGRQLLQSFIDTGYWDEVQVEVSDIAFGNGVLAPEFDYPERCVAKVGGSEMRYYQKQNSGF